MCSPFSSSQEVLRMIVMSSLYCVYIMYSVKKLTTRLRAKCKSILCMEDGRKPRFLTFSFPRKKRFYHSPKLTMTKDVCSDTSFGHYS
jgi:hypothetical protein